jgi:uncharacterized SAM-binding protein YcdF (DUF218 family)
LLPPSGFILLSLLGIALLRRRQKLGLRLLVAGVLLNYLFSIPQTANTLNWLVQRHEPVTVPQLLAARPDAIVVLAGGRYRRAPEYGDDTVHLRTLGRLRYGAWLARQTSLPLLVSGGLACDECNRSEAALMRQVLEEEFGLTGVLIEDTSQTTWENAFHTAALLQPRGIRTIALVTNAAHTMRAVAAFQRAGFQVIPAPTLFFERSFEPLDPYSWIPSKEAVSQIYYDLHELLGHLWYSLRDNGDG